jgi:predicted unusual protein kinase regulating ubiquinone biosynthesis (AarF/ABC1/UbiB family)
MYFSVLILWVWMGCDILMSMIEVPLEQPYTPEHVEARLKEAGVWRALWRVLQILTVLLTGFLWRTIDRWQWTYRNGETVDDRRRRRAMWLLGRLIWLGPAFVKVGQALSTRPDLLPLAYIQVLSALYDRLPPFPNEIAFRCFESELGWKPETLFAQFDPEPFAAASLGQVYHAVTHGGDEVAVKIQRPDLEQVISLDLALVRRLAGLIQRSRRLSRGQDWVAAVDEFGAKLFEELDYVHEAHLTEQFRANLERMPGIAAPRVYWDTTSHRVISTEYIRGIRVTDKAELLAAGVDTSYLLSQGVRANLKQLFEHGLFHADPHPGNLLVRAEDGTLVFIDFGMMGVVHDEQKLRIIEIFVDVINQRPENLKENLIALGCLRPEARWDELMPLANDLFKSIFGAEDRRYRFQDVTSSFAPLIYEYEFRIPIDFAYIARSIMTLEGISLQLDPDFDIFAVSAPYAVRMMLTFPDPSLRRRLMQELLTEQGGVDWERLRQLTRLAAGDRGFRLDAQGLVEPVLDMLLSPEGSALRRALVADVVRDPQAASAPVKELAVFLAADSSLSGQWMVERMVSFLFSAEGEETRAQLAAGLRSNGNGSLDLGRVADLVGLVGQLHPDFRTSTLIRAVGGYLLSDIGKPARNQLFVSGTQWVVDGLMGQLNRWTKATAAPAQAAG